MKEILLIVLFGVIFIALFSGAFFLPEIHDFFADQKIRFNRILNPDKAKETDALFENIINDIHEKRKECDLLSKKELGNFDVNCEMELFDLNRKYGNMLTNTSLRKYSLHKVNTSDFVPY